MMYSTQSTEKAVSEGRVKGVCRTCPYLGIISWGRGDSRTTCKYLGYCPFQVDGAGSFEDEL